MSPGQKEMTMQQFEIKALLDELANPACSFTRHQEISQLFHKAAHRRPAPDSTTDDASMIFEAMLNRLLRVANSRHLPGLFPLFAMICGDRADYVVVAEPDWELMS